MTRIVAGEFKGRRLITADTGVRPTTDKVREALFSSLTNKIDIVGQRVLDLFAGSGALALEAVSRGAGFAVMVEKNRKHVKFLTQNIEALSAGDRAQVVCEDADRFVHQMRGQSDAPLTTDRGFDVIFVDPPYDVDNDSVEALLVGSVENDWLNPAGIFVVERATRTGSIKWPSGVQEVGSRIYGDTTLWYGRLDD